MAIGKFSFPPVPTNIFEAVLQNDEHAVKFYVEEMNVSVATANMIGQTTAHAAAFHGYFDILKYLLSKDASLVVAQDRWNRTVLHMAAEGGALNSVRYLVDQYNADIHKRVCDLYFGNTILHIAAEEGHTDLLKYLIEEKHMDTNMRNSKGQPPVFLAANFDRFSTIQYLAKNTNANFTMTDNRDRSILHVMAAYTNLSVRIPKYLLDELRLPLDVNRKEFEGRTTVSLACNIGHIDLIKYLVGEKGADANICDEVGLAPLHQASAMNNMEVVKYLVEHGADPTAKDREGRRPIEMTGKKEIADYLELETWKRIPEEKPIQTSRHESYYVTPPTPYPDPPINGEDYGTIIRTSTFPGTFDEVSHEDTFIAMDDYGTTRRQFRDAFDEPDYGTTRRRFRDAFDEPDYGTTRRRFRDAFDEPDDKITRKPFRDAFDRRDYETTRKRFRDAFDEPDYETTRKPFRDAFDEEHSDRESADDDSANGRHSRRRDREPSRERRRPGNGRPPREPFRDSREHESNNPRKSDRRYRRSFPETFHADALAKHHFGPLVYSYNSINNANISESSNSEALHNVRSNSGKDVWHSYIGSIFWLANATMRHSKHSAAVLSTPKEMLKNRFDVIALDAVNSAAYK